MRRSAARKFSARDIAAEIVRRATGPNGSKSYVARLSDPPTPAERLQLIAAHLEQRPIVILPHRCSSVEEWLVRYGKLKDG
jgi:hypothetical protein